MRAAGRCVEEAGISGEQSFKRAFPQAGGRETPGVSWLARSWRLKATAKHEAIEDAECESDQGRTVHHRRESNRLTPGALTQIDFSRF